MVKKGMKSEERNRRKTKLKRAKEGNEKKRKELEKEGGGKKGTMTTFSTTTVG